MNNLSAFLHPLVQEDQEVYISKRFIKRDENGEPVLGKDGKTIPVPFKIRPVKQEESDALTKQAKRVRTVNGVRQEYVDSEDFSTRMILLATIEPNFSDSELCAAYGVLDPMQVPKKMLLSGEYAALLKAITALSGFDDDVEEEAKN